MGRVLLGLLQGGRPHAAVIVPPGKTIVAEGERDVDAILQRRALIDVTLFGCEPERMPDLAPLPKLRRVRVLACAIDDLEFLRGCEALEELEVNFTRVRDISPVADLPRLRSATFIGNALDPDDALRAFGARRCGGRPPIVHLPSDEEWRVQRELARRGVKLGFGRVDVHSSGELLVRPGIGKDLLRGKAMSHHADDRVDFVETSTLAMDILFGKIAPGLSTEAFFREMFMDRAPADRGPSRFSTHLSLCDAEDAAKWIAESKLPDADRAALLRFVARFPTLRFCREGAVLGKRVAGNAGVDLPDWLLAQRSAAIAFVEPWRRVRYYFDAFDVAHSPRAEYARDIGYELVLAPSADPDVRAMYASCNAYPIAWWPAEMRSNLLVAPKHGSRKIYECTQEDLFDAKYDGRDPMESVYVAFDSYASMLGHVVAVEVDGERIEAAR